MLIFLFAIIEVSVLVTCIIVKAIVKVIARAIRAIKAKKKSSPSGNRHSYELSDEQREKIVESILEDAILVNDSAYDALINEGEGNYNAVEACKLSAPHDFDLQYGSKSWQRAWSVSLNRWFDCKSKYVGEGVFLVYGKEV